MPKNPELVETHRGHRIWHRPWIKRRPYRCEVPRRVGDRERGADKASQAGCRELIDRAIRGLSRYSMCADQPAQIDCRAVDCQWQKDGGCNNISPAITLNLNGRYFCWTQGDSLSAGATREYRFKDVSTDELARTLILIKQITGFAEDDEFVQALKTEIKRRKE